MDKAQFTYVIYIRATPERIWSGLLEPESTRQYWMHENISDWKVGSPWTHRSTDAAGTVDIVGDVVENDSPRRLVLTWVPPKDAGSPVKTSRVSFDLEPVDWPGGPWTSVRLAHTELEPDSEMLHSISWGWPALMSGLKTLLETGGLASPDATSPI
jgi:uncharacterized protein YndB with AHSA1/START domain